MSRNVFLAFVQEDLDLVNLSRRQAKKEDSQLEFQGSTLFAGSPSPDSFPGS
jgi:hypothetical protein